MYIFYCCRFTNNNTNTIIFAIVISCNIQYILSCNYIWCFMMFFLSFHKYHAIIYDVLWCSFSLFRNIDTSCNVIYIQMVYCTILDVFGHIYIFFHLFFVFFCLSSLLLQRNLIIVSYGAKTWSTVFTCYIYNGYSIQDRHTIVYIW